jgi:hypothetical protein
MLEVKMTNLLPMQEVKMTIFEFWTLTFDINIPTQFEDNPIGTANAKAENGHFLVLELDL